MVYRDHKTIETSDKNFDLINHWKLREHFQESFIHQKFLKYFLKGKNCRKKTEKFRENSKNKEKINL